MYSIYSRNILAYFRWSIIFGDLFLINISQNQSQQRRKSDTRIMFYYTVRYEHNMVNINMIQVRLEDSKYMLISSIITDFLFSTEIQLLLRFTNTPVSTANHFGLLDSPKY